ncbi:MAG: carbohydrate binding domain-containing protein [Halanaerobiales bacterium]|nr:carbohydrate binding domain-containing protein [Bacillota bacterium]HOA41129.1 carbohydrate binding domain-containing protein [Halanaerobiales bacterium]HPZ63368.1 carbohydrate binding domain-containing protein [Halanaerobiales bacterium]HQD03908.1 carbohydrate binding domain-containing protein [Halanaerobiales bacterium]
MKKFLKLFIFMTIIFLMGLAVYAEDGVLEYNFDDGNLNGWGPRGDGVVVEVVDKQSRSGDFSLLTRGRSSNWHGPSLDIHGLVEEGATYQISLWVNLANKPNGGIIVTIEKKKGGDTTWDRVAGPVNARRGRWTQVTGEYTIPAGYDVITVYIESEDATLEYYIDDIKIVKK